MKKVILLIAMALLFIQVNAQLAAGVKAGVNISKENYKKPLYTTSSHLFFSGGAFANYSFSKKFAAQIEASYSPEGTDEEYLSGNTKVTGVVTINRINIPLLIQYKAAAGVYLETGPQIGFVLSAKGKYTNGNYDFKKNTQPTLFSWCIGAGYTLTNTIPGLGINARYAPGISRIDKGSTNAESIKGSTFNISLLYTLLRSKK